MAGKIVTLKQSDEWSAIVKSFKETDVYFYPEYCRAFYENGDGEPMVFYMEEECGRVANVFLKRDLHQDKKFSSLIPLGKYFDISSAYGYGGLLVETSDYPKLQQCFNREFTAFCHENEIISDFVRFHSILGNHKLMEGIYDIEHCRTTVFIELGKGEQYIWDDFDCKCRNNIRKAQNSGITVEYGRDPRLIEAFKDLYRMTMERDHAGSYYYFNKDFFNTTMENLQDNSLIFAASYENHVIASALVIFSDDHAHIHFAASDSEYACLRSNNVLFYEIALWACCQGKKNLHIGGGACGEEDNLFRFKKTFSKTNRLPFFIGKRIYDESVYNALVQLRAKNDSQFDLDTKYFPKYRG